jgi:hypothetical protein
MKAKKLGFSWKGARFLSKHKYKIKMIMIICIHSVPNCQNMTNSRAALDFLSNPDYGKDEDFFSTEGCRTIGAISLRKEFNKARDYFVVFLQKLSGDDGYPNSYIYFLNDESRQVSSIIKAILKEISVTDYQDDIPSLLKCKEHNPKLNEFWDNAIATNGGNIKIRPSRCGNGSYQIRLLQVNTGMSDYAGRTCTLFVSQARSLTKMLDGFVVEIKIHKSQRLSEFLEPWKTPTSEGSLSHLDCPDRARVLEPVAELLNKDGTRWKPAEFTCNGSSEESDEDIPIGLDVVEGV